jgi:hypothetical protein
MIKLLLVLQKKSLLYLEKGNNSKKNKLQKKLYRKKRG